LPKRPILPIDGIRVRLRLLEEADLPLTLAWRNQDHIRKWFLHSELISPEQHQAWFDQYRQRDDDFVFVIEEPREGLRRALGQVAIYNVDWATRRAEFGRLMIGEESAQGRGLAKEATQLLVGEALTGWGLTEVFLEVKEDNNRAIALYRSCGFSIQSQADGILTCVRHSRAALGAATAGPPTPP
jgi:RimJ/RimL family protein N-acetyltransferase